MALNRSFEVEPDNYDAIKLRAKLLLTYHRFSEALEVARRAQTMRPDDHDVYGALTDALVELGDYKEAIEAAQKMVDLRPDTSSYARVSYLRNLHGDTDGAIEAMTVAARAADPRDPEGIAWCRVQLGDELMNAGKRALAEREYDKALYAFPDYHVALAAKARARVVAGVHLHLHRHDEVAHAHLHFHEVETEHAASEHLPSHTHKVKSIGIKPLLVGAMFFRRVNPSRRVAAYIGQIRQNQGSQSGNR
jgi:tetratricopeptide (TPR) repeat protein